jgi:hypothetical protein
MLDFPVAPPIFVKDTPHKRKITTLTEARKLVDEMLRQRRFTILREIKARLDGVKNFEDAIEAIAALRELLVDEDLAGLINLGPELGHRQSFRRPICPLNSDKASRSQALVNRYIIRDRSMTAVDQQKEE